MPPRKKPGKHGMVGDVLYVDEAQIRSRADADKLRGLAPASIVVTKAEEPPPKDVHDYLLLEVLQPMEVSAMDVSAHAARVRAQALQAIAVDDEAARREDFIDRSAIALHAAGWPAKTLWQRAEQLWASRVRYKQGEVIQ